VSRELLLVTRPRRWPARRTDLVEISASAAPPVYKIMDYGKFIFQQKKKQGEAKKKQKVMSPTLALRPELTPQLLG
jgi:translation initiation factor IF-3